jgi:hypothetical protein
MDFTLQLLLILVASPILIFMLHVLTSRAAHWLELPFSPQLVAMACIVLGNVPMGLILWVVVFQELINSPWDLFWTVVYSLLLYNASGHVYFHLFNMSETALRIRMMREIASEAISKDTLAAHYTR